MPSKGNHKQDEKLSEWEKLTANEATDKGLVFKIYKKLMQFFVVKKKKSQSKNGWKT